MNDSFLDKIFRRTIESINEIESRSHLYHGQSLSIDDYKKLHYVENRELNDYIELLPDLTNILNQNVNVLDIGCGEGLAIKQMRDKYHCLVTGTNLNDKKIPGLHTVPCRAANLPFKNNSFDVVVSVHGITWEPDQKRALEEIVRVLRPDGIAYIYLLQFSYSVDLFIGDSFWKGFDRKRYVEKYEFSPNTCLLGCSFHCKEITYPENMVNNCCSEWYITIQKHS